ncbi:uncharacterized protein [Ptychodera flava]
MSRMKSGNRGGVVISNRNELNQLPVGMPSASLSQEEHVMDFVSSGKIKLLCDGQTARSTRTRMESKCDSAFVRSRHGYTADRHHFSLTIPIDQRGSHTIVGVVTDAFIDDGGTFVGSTSRSWGFDLTNNKLIHNGVEHDSTRMFNDPNFEARDEIDLVVDLEADILSFVIDNSFICGMLHFERSDEEAMYIAVSTTRHNCDIKLQYRGTIGTEGGTNKGQTIENLTKSTKHLERCTQSQPFPSGDQDCDSDASQSTVARTTPNINIYNPNIVLVGDNTTCIMKYVTNEKVFKQSLTPPLDLIVKKRARLKPFKKSYTKSSRKMESKGCRLHNDTRVTYNVHSCCKGRFRIKP